MVHQHTAIRVSDLETSVGFYQELLGFEIVRSFEADDGTENTFIGHADPTADDDAEIQLVESDDPVETGDFEHIAFSVQDVDAAVAGVDDDQITEEPATIEEWDVRVAHLEDPCGWGIELIEYL